jgi:hypothetical protein
MVPVHINCNLDDYNSSDFPKEFVAVPRKGELVEIRSDLQDHFTKTLKLPIALEVKRVYHKNGRSGPYIMLDLWYDETTYKLYFPNGLENRR